jgi:hypothetical protein
MRQRAGSTWEQTLLRSWPHSLCLRMAISITYPSTLVLERTVLVVLTAIPLSRPMFLPTVKVCLFIHYPTATC